VYRGPDWWVKIADFGISKRATEGLTALRTEIGTPAFTAPEVDGLLQTDEGSDESYTNAVDIWCMGVITYLILTGETLFSTRRRLVQYVSGSFEFPSDVLLTRQVSTAGCDSVRSSMAVNPKDRPGTKECLQHSWFDGLIEAVIQENQRYYILQARPENSTRVFGDYKWYAAYHVAGHLLGPHQGGLRLCT
jgi:serine/threonine protein kinase